MGRQDTDVGVVYYPAPAEVAYVRPRGTMLIGLERYGWKNFAPHLRV